MRWVELSVSAAALAILSPLLLVVALLVKCTSRGPVLYRARRVGLQGRLFTLYKFRTMVVDASETGPGVTGNGDRRVTRVGRLLRRTKIDELPQLFNLLKGDLGLVGPRPEDPRYVARYTQRQRQLLNVRPGITSPATLLYRHEERLLTGEHFEEVYLSEILPAKLHIELGYQLERSLGSDLKILLGTLWTLFSGSPPISLQPDPKKFQTDSGK